MRIGLAMLAAAALWAPQAWAQVPDDDDQSLVDEIVVTGAMAVRQGGAQDINHFRGQAASFHIPMPDTLTAEGLMGDYDLTLQTAGAPCARMFCVAAESMRASLADRPDDRVLVGLGFGTNIDAATWKRQPLNLVAVVDKSGSMDGEPLDLVRKSLRQIVGQLKAGDQISIVLYGDTSAVHLAPTAIDGAGRRRALAAIDKIESAGSTNMEEGLRVGYDTAFASAGAFRGATRVMLFTDERPNVGGTDAESFMGMAQEASARRVGLTTIGVGVQFDAALATRISSVRGGNLYFMRDEKDVEAVFSKKLDTMVSELAYDLALRLKPNPGYRISGVYGVPADMLVAGPEGEVSVTVPTAFLSTEGGGLFVGLARAEAARNLPEPDLAGAPLMQVNLSYVSALDGSAASDALSVAAPAGAPGANLALGHALVDEYLSLQKATSLFHQDGDEEGAYQTFRQLASRLEANRDARLKPEREMVEVLVAQSARLSGHLGETPRHAAWLDLLGEWEIVRVEGGIDLTRGDRLQLTEDNEAVITRLNGDDEYESFRANNSQLVLDDSNLVFAYRVSAQTLTLTEAETGVELRLKRTSAAE
ncbi:VWA domain-containing protein [Caulobacter sp. 17J65-9]|uniref:vWA domain-containing protein n=1 Tax=Caulobacter sp. 17J65-9 TaxID=2709382 RepID=UPI0013CB5466|nr:VWA domain-containing protein [Caulobacter sp. 17J65-9]NEX92626.1 VWA domain-containing protein [Caulobacter sp. 17J65-9]